MTSFYIENQRNTIVHCTSNEAKKRETAKHQVLLTDTSINTNNSTISTIRDKKLSSFSRFRELECIQLYNWKIRQQNMCFLY